MKSLKLFILSCIFASLLFSTMLLGENEKGSRQDAGIVETIQVPKSYQDGLTSQTAWNVEITWFQNIPQFLVFFWNSKITYLVPQIPVTDSPRKGKVWKSRCSKISPKVYLSNRQLYLNL